MSRLVQWSSQFKKDYKLALKRGCDPNELQEVITLAVFVPFSILYMKEGIKWNFLF